MDVKKIEELIKVLESSRTQELSVRKGAFSVHIVKGSAAKPAASRKKMPKAAHSQTVTPEPDSASYILAPMVGIFHSVDGITKTGSKVESGQVVGAIESMKLLNDVVSDISGTVVEVMVEEGTPVEYGQPLCKVEAA
ncbi:acetyl-CoA carboxylase, biotin carboxyl carrier protein [bacterium]|nr:acetyl-CoA carboxylase, biotin carboxyl carrier protein [bacterium]